MDPKSRRLLRLELAAEGEDRTMALMDMLLSKKRVADRRDWLERNGARAEDLS